MNSDREQVDWILDARNYAREAEHIATRAAEGNLSERDYLAILYCLMVVGEALNQVPVDAFASEPGIPWRSVIALRHRLIHGYWLIDRDIILAIAANEIEALVAALNRLIDRVS
jgi:uncharacterized protein with HEPN domain